MRTRRVAAFAVPVVLALGVAGAVAGPGVAADLLHPRDVEAFQASLQTGGLQSWDASGRPDPANSTSSAVRGHEAAVLAEGDRACAWLHSRPDAPAPDPSGRSASGDLAHAYVASTGFPELAVNPAIRWQIVATAWTHLCWRDQHDKTSPRGTGD